MKDTYKISFPFEGKSQFNEITIESENIIYSEINEDLVGFQTNYEGIVHNSIKVHCKRIAESIRDIEKLKNNTK